MKTTEKKTGFQRNRTNTKNNNGIATLSTSKIKKKIRDTQRTMNKKDISANILVESKRKLKAFQVELAESMINDREKKMSNKYHKIRFFERKKAHRKTKAVKQKLEKSPEDEAIQKKLKEAELDELYVEHYPRTLPYVSLYPNEENEAKDHSFEEKRQKIKAKIREALENGDKDFKLMKRGFRDEYKKQLIAQGLLTEVTVDEEETKADDKADEDDKMEEEESGKTGDDFFE